ncbi:hypothetical protein Tco_1062232 [Tanacetum coccineum]
MGVLHVTRPTGEVAGHNTNPFNTPVLNAEDTEGVFGTDDHEVYSSTEFDCNVHKSPLHNDEGIKGNALVISSIGTNIKEMDKIKAKTDKTGHENGKSAQEPGVC